MVDCLSLKGPGTWLHMSNKPKKLEMDENDCEVSAYECSSGVCVCMEETPTE